MAHDLRHTLENPVFTQKQNASMDTGGYRSSSSSLASSNDSICETGDAVFFTGNCELYFV